MTVLTNLAPSSHARICLQIRLNFPNDRNWFSPNRIVAEKGGKLFRFILLQKIVVSYLFRGTQREEVLRAFHGILQAP